MDAWMTDLVITFSLRFIGNNLKLTTFCKDKTVLRTYTLYSDSLYLHLLYHILSPPIMVFLSHFFTRMMIKRFNRRA